MVNVSVEDYRVASFGNVEDAIAFVRSAFEKADAQCARDEHVFIDGPDTEFAVGGKCGFSNDVWGRARYDWTIADAAGCWAMHNFNPDQLAVVIRDQGEGAEEL